MVAPVFDARSRRVGRPGLHALIIGISRYPNLPPADEAATSDQQHYGLGLRQLTAAATAAFRVYRWLVDNRPLLPVRLTTCRLLIAPGQDEKAAWPRMEDVASNARLETVLNAAAAWRKDASTCEKNMSLFYFAGHGLQRSQGERVLVLEDVGDPEAGGSRLQKAIDTDTLVQGMAPSEDYPHIARRQFYFFDACRMRPTDAFKYESESTTKVFSVPTVRDDYRAAPEFFTTLPGRPAFAIPGHQTLFSEALLWCFRGGGSEMVNQKWCVTIDSLKRGIEYKLAGLTKTHGVRQAIRVNAAGGQEILAYVKDCPDVSVDMHVKPGHLAKHVKVKVDDRHEPAQNFGPPLTPQPFATMLRAGNYDVATYWDATSDEPVSELLAADPPHKDWYLRR